MEGQSSAGDSQYSYQAQSQSAQWSRFVRRNTADPLPGSSSSIAVPAQLPTHIDLETILLPQQSSYRQAQLAQYNRIIAGRAPQSAPLPPLLSAEHIQAVPGTRSGSNSENTARNNKGSSRDGHGNKGSQTPNTGERALITAKDTHTKMPAKKHDSTSPQASRPPPQHQDSIMSHQSNSVPSTPHHHARKFSFESREPSPTANISHSPRSAYSESNITLPSAKPPPPPRIACRYETALAHTRRRMPYSLGDGTLPRIPDTDVKSKLSKDEERCLTTDMRELYDRLLPTKDTDDKRKRLVEKLERLFNGEWPGHDIRVHVFGSSGNLLCTDESDVDICITTPWKELEGVCMIADLLARNGMKEVICVANAKVPIVKIRDPELNLHCDMNVNNTLALENTRMIKTYVEIDPRVRPLAMIIKYWTKRRIVNDAAFGGTLSSYTWICMIINYLQSRTPPILPSLHQRPHLKLPAKDGLESSFADDLNALRGFGQKNEESLGCLLFNFFRFYGHEFDYENLVVSVRHGKQISKYAKGWHLGYANNSLCVEEPFNTGRNLGNTADMTSFRGLHMELRRAFDMISSVKLDKCCEQYEFPIEEKPQPAKKSSSVPVVIRSASQSHGHGQQNKRGRGGHRGRNNNLHGNNNRRASSGNFESHLAYGPGMPGNHVSHETWLQQQAQAQLHNELYTTYSVLQAQETSLRMQLYSQSQAYMQAQAGQSQNYGHSQSRASSSSRHQPGDRSRTSSFDQAPHTAPIRPDMFYYPLHYNGSPVYGYQTSSTNPSSPQLGAVLPELRRGVHRSSVTNGSSPQPNSSFRSHSQPAARSAPSPMVLPGIGMPNQDLGNYQQHRQVNGIPIPNFIADENTDVGYETASESHASGPSQDFPTSREYVGYYVNGSTLPPARRDRSAPLAIPTFGDIQQSRRRLSTDQLPQSILDRMKRPSRSPSPLGHDRSFSNGPQSAPMTASSSQQGVSGFNYRSFPDHAPAVVNGSNMPNPISIPHWRASISEGSEDPSGDSDISRSSGQLSDMSLDDIRSGQTTPRGTRPDRQSEHPVVVNGTAHAEAFPAFTSPPVVNGSSPRRPITPNTSAIGEQANGTTRTSPGARKRLPRQPQNGGMSPLDIGLGLGEILREDLPHLSPVYETRTPSPSANRKIGLGSNRDAVSGGGNSKAERTALSNLVPKMGNGHTETAKPNLPELKTNGHTRAAKSEGSGPGTWHTITKGKKKGIPTEMMGPQLLGEKLPSKSSERKGG